MLTTLLTYYGAVTGLLSAAAMAVHAFKQDDTAVGKIIVTAANDAVGLYKVFSSFGKK